MVAAERIGWRRVLFRLLPGLVGAWLAAVGPAASADPPQRLEPAALTRVLALGPWPPPLTRDPSNRASGRPQAIVFGEVLFHSARLSSVGGLRCASCHEPWRGFVDGRKLGLGAAPGTRNTLSLFNVGLNRWFGWDGANDNLWAQSIRPLLDPGEMASSAARIGALVRGDAGLARLYEGAFGAPPPPDDEALLADVGKALAAYQETLVSPRTRFDAFRDALARDGREAAAGYPLDALRGLQVFVGPGRCIACHAGPGFTDGLFHRSRIASTLRDGEPDAGRQSGLKRLAASPYTLLRRFHRSASSAFEPTCR